ncbi:flagellar motor switch protein FliN [Aurantimonas manganoxydans]|uniref:flagellar motor switch protein FliN n=1 Tax=Aurantimonas manganoxydans TaxID=651183 RepID=UPI0002FB7EED|nr:flagellar motor switch protein FliN [Aurantimonas manganoxydans]
MTDDNFATSSADLGTGRMDLDLVKDLQVTMHIVLGSTSMTVAEVLDLGRGAVVKLESKVGDPVDVIINGRVIARGEIVVLDNEEQRFGVTLTEVAKPGARIATKNQRAA